MELNPEKEKMVYEDLPKSLKEVVSKTVDEISEEEKSEINTIFHKAQGMIEDILTFDYKYSKSDVERFVPQLMEEYKRKVKEEAQEQRYNTSLNGSKIISDMGSKEVVKAEEIYSEDEKRNGLRRAYGNIVGYSEDIINDENIEANRKYNNKIEDLILTELKSEIKRKIDPYSSINAENAFADISSVLSRRLLGELQQDFEENSRMLKRAISSKVNEVVIEFGNDYEKAIQKDEQSKDAGEQTKSDEDKKLDFSNLLATSEEIANKDNERMQRVEEKTLENGEKMKYVNGFPQL